MANCNQKLASGICFVPNDVSTKGFRLKGICKESENYFDLDFKIFGTFNGRPHFKGTGNSHIYFNSTSSRWHLQSLIDPNRFFFTTKSNQNTLIPIGRREWEIGAFSSDCQSEVVGVVTSRINLTLSKCFPNMFTCNSGDCIKLSDKCNTEFDCEDRSDEQDCDYLRFGQSYSREQIPRDRKGEPVIILMNTSVIAFPVIDTVNLKFTADFILGLRWYDLRIDYRDLNNVTSLNSLSMEDQKIIWTPRLAFTNALGPFQTQIDSLSTGVLTREGDPMPEDSSLATEALLFSGKSNSISMTREYFLEYACDFDLLYYPFDTQVCKMVFEVQGKTDNYVQLQKDGKGVEFLGGRNLIEYEIQLEDLQFESVQVSS